jgi:dienelactone hydrolase
MRTVFALGLAAVSSLLALACSTEDRDAQKCKITGPFGSGRGYSFGGALVNYYAAHAARWNVPVPRSVYSIFPTTRVAGRPAGKPPSSVDFTLLAGDRDEVVGTAGAEDFLAWLKSHRVARRTYRVVRSTGALVASHEAPKETTTASTRAFWAPIDELVTAARESR